MDTARFDHLTRSLAIHVPRRQTLRLLSVLAPLLGTAAVALAPEESAADNGKGNGNGKGGNGGGKGGGKGGKGNGKNNKNNGKKDDKKHNKKDDADDDILPPLCTTSQRLCATTNMCVPVCLDTSYVFDAASCTCKCPAGKTACAVGCVDACPPFSGKVMDYQTCTCECPVGKTECAVGCVDACPPFSGKVMDYQTCTCECPANKEECNGVCLPVCDPPHHRDPGNACLCDCPVGQVECNGHCLPSCGPGLVRDPESCACVCRPGAAGRGGENQALAEACCSGSVCGGLICCDAGQTCTTGSYGGQPRANCCLPMPGMLGACDGVCCETPASVTKCCPGKSNPCHAASVPC